MAAVDKPEAAVERALAGKAPRRQAPMFLRLLGSFAGTMALTFTALGGVYVTGPIARALEPRLQPQSRRAFEAHPAYEAMLASVPTWLITCAQPGRIGWAALANSAQA